MKCRMDGVGLALTFAALLVTSCTQRVQDSVTSAGPRSGLALTADVLGVTDLAEVGLRVDRVTCAGEPVIPYSWEDTSPLEDTLLGGVNQASPDAGVPEGRHVFADRFVSLQPGCYTVEARPLDASGQPSVNCLSATTGARVNPGVTSEVLLLIQCSSPALGGLDNLIAINHAPTLEALTYDPSKFVDACEEVKLCATARDADRNHLQFQWSVAGSTSAFVVVEEIQEGDRVKQCVTFAAASYADLWLDVRVYDLGDSRTGRRMEDLAQAQNANATSHAELQFPLHPSVNLLDCHDPLSARTFPADGTRTRNYRSDCQPPPLADAFCGTDAPASPQACPNGVFDPGAVFNRCEDDDGDGLVTPLEKELSITVGNADPDADGLPNWLDQDSDGDGIDDGTEGLVETDGDGTPDVLDPDDDGDGVPTATEISDAPADDDRDGDGLVNRLDPDADGDGLTDGLDGVEDGDGDGAPNYLDDDDDGDGVPTATETTDANANDDRDGDGLVNRLDPDADGDGLTDGLDGADDSDGDAIPNYLDADDDGDGVPTATEISDAAARDDRDGDGRENRLDSDADGDGFTDGLDGLDDSDGDAIPNYLDPDSSPAVIPGGNALLCETGTGVRVTMDGTNAAPVPVDLVLVVDESGSIDGASFAQLKAFLAGLVDGLDGLYAAGGSVGLVMFSGDARVVASPSTNQNALLNTIASVSQRGGSTCIGCGLNMATQQLSTLPASHRRVVILLTDGMDNRPSVNLASAVAAAQAANIQRLVVGVGSGVNPGQLQQVAAGLGAQQVFLVSDFGVLQTLTQTLLASLNQQVGVLVIDVNPLLVVSGVVVDHGAVSVSGNRITWNVVSTPDDTVTLEYQVARAPGAPPGALAVHAAVSFTDGSGTPAMPVNLRVSVVGCGN